MASYDELFLFDDPNFDSREPSPAPLSQYWLDENTGFDGSRASTPNLLQSLPWLGDSPYGSRESSPGPGIRYTPSPELSELGSPYRRPRRRNRRTLHRSVTSRSSVTDSDLDISTPPLPARNLMEEIDRDANMLLLQNLSNDLSFPTLEFEDRKTQQLQQSPFPPSLAPGFKFPTSNNSRGRQLPRLDLQQPIHQSSVNDDLQMMSPNPIRFMNGNEISNIFFQEPANNTNMSLPASSLPDSDPFENIAQQAHKQTASVPAVQKSWLDIPFEENNDLITPTQATFSPSPLPTTDTASTSITSSTTTDPNILFLDNLISEYTATLGTPPSVTSTPSNTQKSPPASDFLSSPPSDFLSPPPSLDSFFISSYQAPTSVPTPVRTPAPPPKRNLTRTSTPRASTPRPYGPAPLDRSKTDPSLLFLENLTHSHNNIPPQSRFNPNSRASTASPAMFPDEETGEAGDTGPFSFVNFTLGDGDTLLNGVAPSGSGKTKARREREVEREREEIRERAMRAIAMAGGDVGVLWKN